MTLFLCERKAERNSERFVIYERIVQEWAPKIDKARIFLRRRIKFFLRAAERSAGDKAARVPSDALAAFILGRFYGSAGRLPIGINELFAA
jgi:hypothetical protein